GSCGSLCSKLLAAVSPDYEEEKQKVLCSCIPFAHEKLRDIIRSQQLNSVQDVLDIYGNGKGCEICKPALSYMVDVAACGDHEEDRSPTIVFVIEGTRVKSVQVKTGISDNSYVEILDGLKGGEEVVKGNYSAVSKDLEDKKLIKIDNGGSSAKPEEKKK
ncbi:MAG: (2Fe-2S)-binding protein, partial [Ignavibacteriota bacterium]